MRNQPQYNFLKNTGYALAGLQDMLKNETSFKIELLLSIILLPLLIFIEISTIYKMLMFISLMGILIAEATNSAIERVVDLVTLEHNPMAGRAKDIGSSIVFLSILVFVTTWSISLYQLYK